MSEAVSDAIVIVDYDPRWPRMFEEERARILEAIGHWAADVQHGYECLGEFGLPGRIYFRKLTGTLLPGQSHDGVGRTHQIHMYERSNEQYEKQIVFRDYLRTHPDAMRDYEALKRELAARHSRDVEAYALAKSDFVLEILRRAREERKRATLR